MASSVRLGVAMLNDINGVGERVSDVNDDIVIALGVSPSVDVQTTTECGNSRITERICSGRSAGVVGSAVGDIGGEVCHE